MKKRRKKSKTNTIRQQFTRGCHDLHSHTYAESSLLSLCIHSLHSIRHISQNVCVLIVWVTFFSSFLGFMISCSMTITIDGWSNLHKSVLWWWYTAQRQKVLYYMFSARRYFGKSWGLLEFAWSVKKNVECISSVCVSHDHLEDR